MPKIYLADQKKTITAEKNATLLETLRSAGCHVDAPCNGNKTCRKCTVIVNGEPEYSCEYIVTDDIEIALTSSDRLQTAGDPPRNPAPPRGQEDRFLDQSPQTAPVDCAASVPAPPPAPGARELGIALDVGTTGLSLCIIDMLTGENLGATSRLNPQCRFGGDVLTRICYCRDTKGGLATLRDLVHNEAASMAHELLEAGGLSPDDVRRTTVAGNTVMLHIFAGVSPESISYYPYAPVFTDPIEIKDSPLAMNEKGTVTLLPSVSGYIGGDITAGMAAIDFQSSEVTALFIDIGTNGEMVLVRDRQLYAASTAAGPALEGMNIDCGMRAVPGAVERVYDNDGDTDSGLAFDVIGGVTPIGICGSGLIDLTARLLEMEVIDAAGKMDSWRPDVKDKKYHLTENVYLSQKDVRQVQLAKGAIAAGIQLLLQTSGADYTDIERVYIAGSFGNSLDVASMKTIGMLDASCDCPVSFVGNTSLAGAAMVLRDLELLDKMQRTKEKVKVTELAELPEFQKVFMSNLHF